MDQNVKASLDQILSNLEFIGRIDRIEDETIFLEVEDFGGLLACCDFANPEQLASWKDYKLQFESEKRSRWPSAEFLTKDPELSLIHESLRQELYYLKIHGIKKILRSRSVLEWCQKDHFTAWKFFRFYQQMDQLSDVSSKLIETDQYLDFRKVKRSLNYASIRTIASWIKFLTLEVQDLQTGTEIHGAMIDFSNSNNPERDEYVIRAYLENEKLEDIRVAVNANKDWEPLDKIQGINQIRNRLGVPPRRSRK